MPNACAHIDIKVAGSVEIMKAIAKSYLGSRGKEILMFSTIQRFVNRKFKNKITIYILLLMHIYFFAKDIDTENLKQKRNVNNNNHSYSE